MRSQDQTLETAEDPFLLLKALDLLQKHHPLDVKQVQRHRPLLLQTLQPGAISCLHCAAQLCRAGRARLVVAKDALDDLLDVMSQR